MFLTKKLTSTRIAAAALVGCLSAGISASGADKLSGFLALDFNSHFMSYGVNVWGADTESIGDKILFQPSFGLEFEVAEGSAVYGGVWGDINNIAPSSIGGKIQEVDIWLGYYFPVGDFTIDLTLNQWYYGGETEGTFDVTVSYDAIALAPYIVAHHRFDPNGAQFKGTIFEVGATLYEFDYESFSFSFPAAFAFALDDYYVNGEDGYAYSLIGANFSVPLSSSGEYGDWDLYGGLTFFHTDKDFTGNAKSTYLTGSIGVGLSF